MSAQVVDRDDGGGGGGAVRQAQIHRVHHKLLSITWMMRVAVPIIGGSPVQGAKHLFVSTMVEFGFVYTNRSLTVAHCGQQDSVATVNHVRGIPVRQLDCSDVTCEGIHSHPASRISS